MGEEAARKKTGEILREIRASKKAPGQDRIYTAGEKEYLVWKERENSGVPINEAVQKEINDVRDKLGLSYTFPWEDNYVPYEKEEKITSHIERK